MGDSAEDFGAMFGGTAVVFAGFVFQLGVVFLFRVTVARYLTVEAFGLLTIFIAAVNTAGLVSVAGLDVGIGRYLPRYEDGVPDRADVVRSAVEVAVPLSVGVGGALVLGAEWVAVGVFRQPELHPLLVVAAIAIPFYGLQQLALGTARGQGRTVPKVAIQHVLAPGAQLLLALVVIVAGYRTLEIATAYAGGIVLSGLVGAWYLLRRSPLGLGRRGSMHRTLAVFSIPLVVTGIMFNLIHYLDTFLLGYFTTPTDVGIYNTVYPLSQLCTVFLSAFGFLFLPTISGLESEDRLGRADTLAKLTAKWIFFLTFPLFVLMFYFPETSISLTFGAKYSTGAPALAVLVLGFVVHAGFGPTGKGLVALGRTRLVMVDNIVAALVNVGLNVLLIPRLGFFGAALASVGAFWTLDVLWLYQLHKHADIVPVSRGLVRVAALTVPASAVVYLGAGQLVGDPLLRVGGAIAAMVAIHLVVVLRYGDISEEEFAILDHAERGLGVDLSLVRRTAIRLRQ